MPLGTIKRERGEGERKKNREYRILYTFNKPLNSRFSFSGNPPVTGSETKNPSRLESRCIYLYIRIFMWHNVKPHNSNLSVVCVLSADSLSIVIKHTTYAFITMTRSTSEHVRLIYYVSTLPPTGWPVKCFMTLHRAVLFSYDKLW